MVAPHIQPYTDFSGIAAAGGSWLEAEKKKAEIANLNSRTNNTDADTERRKLEYKQQRILFDNGTWQREIEANIGVKESQIHMNEEQVKNFEVYRDKMNSEIQLNYAKTNVTEEEVNLIQEQAAYVQKQVWYLGEKNKREWGLTNAQINQMSALAGYYIALKAQTEQLTPYLVQKTVQEIENLGADKRLKDALTGESKGRYNLSVQQAQNVREDTKSKRRKNNIDQYRYGDGSGFVGNFSAFVMDVMPSFSMVIK